MVNVPLDAIAAYLAGSAVTIAVTVVFLVVYFRWEWARMPAEDRWLLSELARVRRPDGTAPAGEVADIYERYSNLLRSGHP